jgi:hypothetical protein
MTPTRRELEQRRAQACRLHSEFALTSLDEAEAFLRDRWLLTLTPDTALPSLFGAVHEEPYAPGRPGFGAYPKTKWWWGGALGSRDHVVTTKLHRGKTLYLSPEAARLVDPLCRSALADAERNGYGDVARRLVEHLAAAGPSLVEDLKNELALDAKALRTARTRLEAAGAIIGTGVRTEVGGGHRHSSRIARWDQAGVPTSDASTIEALAAAIVAGVRAAVIVERTEPREWFGWLVDVSLIDALLETGRLLAVDNGLVTASED